MNGGDGKRRVGVERAALFLRGAKRGNESRARLQEQV